MNDPSAKILRAAAARGARDARNTAKLLGAEDLRVWAREQFAAAEEARHAGAPVDVRRLEVAAREALLLVSETGT